MEKCDNISGFSGDLYAHYGNAEQVAAAPSIWKAILAQGAIPLGSNAWNKLRIIRGTECLDLFIFPKAYTVIALEYIPSDHPLPGSMFQGFYRC
ncbi:uncharacterized protein HKW66_Vig0010730 [Vigna angularis]|uniref:Uncharacterized protein n=1 Tax=Phaseolus angularis TaxID=3914 RepID=A0A8T0LHM0_PHAAN|nr:uncharacterized protein HKW66_Vig0010730 [Vigna angularis]